MIDFYEKFDKITIKVLRKVYKQAFMPLYPIFSRYSPKIDQSQSAFFFGTEEVFLKVIL